MREEPTAALEAPRVRLLHPFWSREIQRVRDGAPAGERRKQRQLPAPNMGGLAHERLLAELACRAEDGGRVFLDDLLAALERSPRRGEVGRADLERLRHRGVVAADGDLVEAFLGVDVVDLVDATGRGTDQAVTPVDAVGLIDSFVARVPRHRELGGERSGDTIG